jgi:hypothetical protein
MRLKTAARQRASTAPIGSEDVEPGLISQECRYGLCLDSSLFGYLQKLANASFSSSYASSTESILVIRNSIRISAAGLSSLSMPRFLTT